jgi:hypothetical protein
MAIVEYEVETEVLTEREQRARTLEAAALEIEVRGWGRGMLMAVDGSVCINGAIGLATVIPHDAQGGSSHSLDHSHRMGYHDVGRKTWGRSYNYERLAYFNDHLVDSAEATFLLRWRAEEIRDGWDA